MTTNFDFETIAKAQNHIAGFVDVSTKEGQREAERLMQIATIRDRDEILVVTENLMRYCRIHNIEYFASCTQCNTLGGDESKRQESPVVVDAALDRQWIAGAQFGWNCGAVGNIEALNQAIDARRKEIRDWQSEK